MEQQPSTIRKYLKKIALWAIAIYLLAGVILYFLQDKLLFHPEVLPVNYQYKFDVPFQEMLIPVNKKVKLSAVLFKAEKPRGMVLYFHGNTANINRYAKYMPDFTRNGYDVLIMDYREFGKSTGRLTEEALYEDALLMYKVARTRFAPHQIVIYGKSLGTGIATELASVRDCRRLILETPYYSIHDVAAEVAPIYPYSLMLDFKLPTYEYLPKVTAPVVIFHGTDDDTVPYASGEKLKTFFKPGDTLFTIQGGEHNNLGDYPFYHQKLDSILQR
ncbi:alpha/beta hydrolase [Chitinophaga rhizosphaerae]|uniref:alpha/beta hydrolase n=1 Tax=Chitinophaga rhizosphaerae TaxID=1864947 RepID=UPI000F80B8FA|nr:alpha/beta hydrolase [Chitinophaga rhizosphaerae]